jgi:mRNA interferase MazF
VPNPCTCPGQNIADHPSTLIIPLTSNLIEGAEPLRKRVPASGRLSRDSDFIIDQLRAIDNRRLMSGPLTQINQNLLARVNEAIGEILGLVEE